MENYFHQEFVLFEDDTIQVELPLEVIEFNNVYNVGSYDNVWFGISTTPGGTYILQKANANWDQGILNGNVYNYITQNITGGDEDNYSVPPTSVSPVGGVGAILSVQINALGVINTAVCQFTNGGIGYQAGDVLTFASTLFGGSTDQDLKITLDDTVFPTVPENTGDIEINAPNGPNGPATIIVNFNQSDFNADSGPLVTGNNYYWEVVVGETIAYSTTNYNVPTQVVAAGELYVSTSMFSSEGYRP